MKDFRHYIALREKYNLKTATPEEEAEFVELHDSGKFAGDEEALGHDAWDKLASIERTEADRQLNEEMYAEFMAGRKKSHVRRIGRTATWLAAASVAIGALVIGYWNYKPNEARTVLVAESTLTVINGPNYIKLPDRSTVELKSGSRLSYSESQYLSNREVSLVGTAYFDITHDPAHRFTVRSGRVVTTVLGTSFVVSESDDSRFIDVTVVTGKVAVGDGVTVFRTVAPNQKLSLRTDNPDRQITYSLNAEASIKKELKFKENNILFDGVSLGDAVEILEKRFGVEIDVENKRIEPCLLKLSFVHDETLKDVLDYICPLFDATPVIDGKHVTIKGGIPCDNSN